MLPIFRLTALALMLMAGDGLAQGAPAPGEDEAAAAAATKRKPARNLAFYSTEVTLASANERRGATIRALGEVVVRLTGNTKAMANPVIRRGVGNLDALVTRSSVRQDSDTVNGVPVYKSVLSVSFDPEAVDALIAGAGLRYWGSNRPKPILWLAINDGRGPRLVTGQQTNVVRPLATRGLERGMRFLLPNGTAVEQAAVPSIVALNAPALQVLTSRYRNDTQLVGKVYRKPPGWAADWVLSQDGVELARWSHSDANPRKVIASGVDEGADAIARRDAVVMDTGVAGLHSVEIAGVRSQGDYVRLMAYLQGMAVIRKVTVVEATPDQLRLQLDLTIGMKGFNGMINTGDTLRPLDEAAGSGTGVSRFILQ